MENAAVVTLLKKVDFSSKVVYILSAKCKKSTSSSYRVQISKKSAKVLVYCMRHSDIFPQLAK
jgi:hypothetical protein